MNKQPSFIVQPMRRGWTSTSGQVVLSYIRQKQASKQHSSMTSASNAASRFLPGVSALAPLTNGE